MTERLHENEARVEELTKNWTSKWRETQKIIEVNKTEPMRKSNHPECPVRRAGNTFHSKLCYIKSIFPFLFSVFFRSELSASDTKVLASKWNRSFLIWSVSMMTY